MHIEPRCKPPIVPVLETQRLRLRGHRPLDIEHLAPMWADPAVVRFIGSGPRSRTLVWRNLLRHVGSWALLGYGYWVIERRDTGAFIGEIGLMENQRQTEPSFPGTPEAGWATVPEAWGNGYATEALRAVIDWTDRHLSAPQLCCIFDPKHKASQRVAAKVGFQPWRSVMMDGAVTTVFTRDAPG